MTLATLPIAAPRPRRARKAPPPPKPFTLAHFRAWAADLVLDSGEQVTIEPFQADFIADVFAGKPECWFVVPEGNGKTTIVALLALYHCEFHPFASVPVAASSREQAEILYRQAEGFVLRSPRLHERVHSDIQQAKGKIKTQVPRFICLEGYRRIVHHGGGRIQVFAADDRTGDGVIPTLGILDELHRHRNLGLYRTWAGKLQKRKGQIVTISTAGEPGSEFEQTRERIRQQSAEVVRKGPHIRAISERVVLHEWAVPEKADHTDFGIVKSANPFTGITQDSLRAKYASPTMTPAHWMRFVCNRPTRGDNSAITEAEWRHAKVGDEIPAGIPIWAGLDVAWKWDTTALVPYWDRDAGYRLLGPATVLVPPRDGSSLDPAAVEAAILAVHERNPIHTVVMDLSRAEQLGMWIETEIGATVIDRSQGNAMAVQDYDRFMEGLRGGVLHHTGDIALTSHAMNAVARILPQGDARFDRSSANRQSVEQDRRVIDALTAAAMVHAQATKLAEPVGEVFMSWA